MKPELVQLRDLLRQRLDLIADHAFRDRDPAAHLAELQRLSEALQSEHQRLKPILPAQLNHFLTQSSLVKAYEFLSQSTS